jgi:hypothetical protein
MLSKDLRFKCSTVGKYCEEKSTGRSSLRKKWAETSVPLRGSLVYLVYLVYLVCFVVGEGLSGLSRQLRCSEKAVTSGQ